MKEARPRRDRRDPVERFWASVDVRGPSECWVWQKTKSPSGYGQFKARSYVQVYAHRYSYELANGPIPDGLAVDHICANRSCVNPAHLDVCTAEENSRRGAVRRKVCRNGLHDLTAPNAWIVVGRRRIRTCRECYKAREARRPKRSRSLRPRHP